MTPEQLAAALRSIYGPGHGWRTKAAAGLYIDTATLRRYLTGKSQIPGPVIAAVECWLAAKNQATPGHR